MHIPEIAVIDANTLSCLGLQNLLNEIIPQAIIRTFHSFRDLTDDTPDMYAHYFVSAQIFFEHTAFFRQRLTQTIVLAGSDSLPRLAGVKTLNICQDENGLARSILQLHRHGHQGGHPGSEVMSVENLGAGMHDLSVREIEVLCLVALTLYLFMENKPFLLSADPFLLLAPCVFFGSGKTDAAQPLPVVCKRANDP